MDPLIARIAATEAAFRQMAMSSDARARQEAVRLGRELVELRHEQTRAMPGPRPPAVRPLPGPASVAAEAAQARATMLGPDYQMRSTMLEPRPVVVRPTMLDPDLYQARPAARSTMLGPEYESRRTMLVPPRPPAQPTTLVRSPGPAQQTQLSPASVAASFADQRSAEAVAARRARNTALLSWEEPGTQARKTQLSPAAVAAQFEDQRSAEAVAAQRARNTALLSWEEAGSPARRTALATTEQMQGATRPEQIRPPAAAARTTPARPTMLGPGYESRRTMLAEPEEKPAEPAEAPPSQRFTVLEAARASFEGPTPAWAAAMAATQRAGWDLGEQRQAERVAAAAAPPPAAAPGAMTGLAPPLAPLVPLGGQTGPAVAKAVTKVVTSLGEVADEGGRVARGLKPLGWIEPRVATGMERFMEGLGKGVRGVAALAMLDPTVSKIAGLFGGTMRGAATGYTVGGPIGAAAGGAMGFVGDVMGMGGAANPRSQATLTESLSLLATRIGTMIGADFWMDTMSKAVQDTANMGGPGKTRSFMGRAAGYVSRDLGDMGPLSVMASVSPAAWTYGAIRAGISGGGAPPVPDMQAAPVLAGVGGAMGSAMSYESHAQAFGMSSLNASPILQQQMLEQLQNMAGDMKEMKLNTEALKNIVPAWR